MTVTTAEKLTGLQLLSEGKVGHAYICTTDGDLYNAVVIRTNGGEIINKRTMDAVTINNDFLKARFVPYAEKETISTPALETLTEIDGKAVVAVSSDEAIKAYTAGKQAWAQFLTTCVCGECEVEVEVKVKSFEKDFSMLGDLEREIEDAESDESDEEFPQLLKLFVVNQLKEKIEEDRDELRLKAVIPLPALISGKFYIEK